MKLSHSGSSVTDLSLTKTSLLHDFHKRLWATFFCVWRKLEEKNKKDVSLHHKAGFEADVMRPCGRGEVDWGR